MLHGVERHSIKCIVAFIQIIYSLIKEVDEFMKKLVVVE
nr:MAG TPA: hypothetical protein [Caudoviricetes sp.]